MGQKYVGWVLAGRDKSTVRSFALHGGSVPEFDMSASTGRRAQNLKSH